ncbi:hypothetical protein SGGMMB4_05164 [Sodalis glossinidius str. 'morsitans']|uniref:Uncharacterized protein n=1 Tax=Sodalis glossinidius (strain morsitans) TaxID=343509 RepID=A0A193QMN1_SODGM|nr:hypothetical protein SGGMMB4_05164 [Sodalis glossinidius str. 'morsitans']
MIEHNVFLQFRQDASKETIQSVAQALLAFRASKTRAGTKTAAAYSAIKASATCLRCGSTIGLRWKCIWPIPIIIRSVLTFCCRHWRRGASLANGFRSVGGGG